MRVLALLLTLVLQQPPATVQGVVVDSETGQALAGATVVAQNPHDASGARLITVTESDGRFEFRGIPPGQYVIEAGRAGYVSDTAGSTPASPNRLLNPLAPQTKLLVQELLPGRILSDLRLALTPGGVITGRLTTDRGEVVTGAIVQAFKTTYKDGLRERTLVQSVVSNDLGEYRFFMLKPGQYYIALEPPAVWLRNVSSQRFSIPLYYPGTVDANAATGLDLGVGQTIEGVDFWAIPTGNRRISGGVEGNGGDGVTVVLSPLNGTAKKTVTIRSDSPNPEFQFSDIVPGTYMLAAQNIYGKAAMPLDIRNADLLGVRIILRPGYRIPVRVRIDGHPPGDDPELGKLFFDIRPDTPIPGLELETYSPFANGRFTLDLLRGVYWVEVSRTEDYYIRSIALEGTDVLNGGLHATGSVEGPMEILVGTDFGEVQGAAVAPDVTVVLAPDATRRNQRRLYKSIKTGNGAFHFKQVPPGDYKLFAWSDETIENGGPWLDPDYLRRYEDAATAVNVQADAKTILDHPISVLDRKDALR